MREPASSECRTWDAFPWLVALSEKTLFRARFVDPAEVALANARLLTGETPKEVLGWAAQRLPLTSVRSVEWVPQVQTLLVRRGWWRDPWRLPFAEADEGEKAFRYLANLLPGPNEPVEARVGPNDLPMDPRLGVGVLLAFLGLIALVGGAVEGVGQAPLMGPARRFVVFAELGETLGLGVVVGIGAVALAAGLGGLVWWVRSRPTKWVVRAQREKERG